MLCTLLLSRYVSVPRLPLVFVAFCILADFCVLAHNGETWPLPALLKLSPTTVCPGLGVRDRPLPPRGARLPHFGEPPGRGSPRACALRPLFCCPPPPRPESPLPAYSSQTSPPSAHRLALGVPSHPRASQEPQQQAQAHWCLSEEHPGPPSPPCPGPRGHSQPQPSGARQADSIHSGTLRSMPPPPPPSASESEILSS
ncbi:unnamed protein product [Pipistrellus nathusii]|uniref:Uncharacterized protein n=1 Tax=Pipistrellus nathusii TaxID=59473 RepID=A0ABP0AJI0_PIPNA